MPKKKSASKLAGRVKRLEKTVSEHGHRIVKCEKRIKTVGGMMGLKFGKKHAKKSKKSRAAHAAAN